MPAGELVVSWGDDAWPLVSDACALILMTVSLLVSPQSCGLRRIAGRNVRIDVRRSEARARKRPNASRPCACRRMRRQVDQALSSVAGTCLRIGLHARVGRS